MCTYVRFFLNAPKQMKSNYNPGDFCLLPSSVFGWERWLSKKKIRCPHIILSSIGGSRACEGNSLNFWLSTHYCAMVGKKCRRDSLIIHSSTYHPSAHHHYRPSIHLSTHPNIQQIRNACHVPGTILKFSDTAVNKAYKNACLQRIYLLE